MRPLRTDSLKISGQQKTVACHIYMNRTLIRKWWMQSGLVEIHPSCHSLKHAAMCLLSRCERIPLCTLRRPLIYCMWQLCRQLKPSYWCLNPQLVFIFQCHSIIWKYLISLSVIIRDIRHNQGSISAPFLTCHCLLTMGSRETGLT